MSERDSEETPCQRAMVKDISFLWFPSWQANFFLFFLNGFRRFLFSSFLRGWEHFFLKCFPSFVF